MASVLPFTLTLEARRKLAACYAFLLSLDGRGQEGVDDQDKGEARDVHPVASSPNGDELQLE